VAGAVPDSDRVYCLKGYKNEFWQYNPNNDSWTPLTNAPSLKYANGSWIALVEGLLGTSGRRIYCHTAKTHGFNAYDPSTGTWGPALTGMPLLGMMGKSKKSKDGGSAITYENSIYAFKGGNTQEFWRYTISDTAAGLWKELDTIGLIGQGSTKKKKVGKGGDITLIVPSGKGVPADLPALKGNSTNELWIYNTGVTFGQPEPRRDGVTAATVGNRHQSLVIAPNPLAAGFAQLSYSLPKAGALGIRVFDVTGRTVVARTAVTGRTGTLNLDLRQLADGVYLVRLDADGYSIQQKLVVQH
jgi:hypothetical protein